MLFVEFPAYGRYRTLTFTDPLTEGEDVYALQTALQAFGEDPGVIDGILGRNTFSAIVNAQGKLKIVRDGRAGGVTQTELTHNLADRARVKYSLPKGLVFGQLSHESGCRVGNYSPQRADGTFDAGVAQRNTKYTKPRDGFAVPSSIDALGSNLRKYYDKYVGVNQIGRRWALAAGAWNAPAFANWIARSEGAKSISTNETLRPGSTARETLERYMRSATAFMEL